METPKHGTAPAPSMSEALFHSSRFMRIPSQSCNAGKEWTAGNRPQLRALVTDSDRRTSLNAPSTHFDPILSQSFDFGRVKEEKKSVTVPFDHPEAKVTILPAFLKISCIMVGLLLLVSVVRISHFQVITHQLSSMIYPTYADCDLRIAALEDALYKLTRDRVARQDFAFRYSGGDIIPSLTTRVISKGPPLNDPIIALDDDLRQGRCWKLYGTSGQLGIMLSERVFVTHVTIEHVARELVSNVHSSPRNVTIWGVSEQSNATFDPPSRSPPISNGYHFVVLASIIYDINAKDNVQTFPVFDSYTLMNLSVKVVVAEIVDNWGSNTTCLYRVRVHGRCSGCPN